MEDNSEFHLRNETVSQAYKIYKREVGGVTFDGKPMKEFQELPNKIKNAWITIDKVLSKDF